MPLYAWSSATPAESRCLRDCPPMKLRTALIFALALALAAPSAASAAKVVRGSSFYRFRAEAGEVNRLKVTVSKTAVEFADSGASEVAPAKTHAVRLCRQVSDRRLRCPLTRKNAPPFFGVFTYLSDRDDSARFKSVKGGTIGGSVDGEAGEDVLTASTTGSWLSGGSGDDVLQGNDGDDNMQGDAGTDVIRGGAGRDIAYYSRRDERATPVSATLDGQPNDGAPGENDAIAADVEGVDAGGSFGTTTPDDTVIGNDGPNTLSATGQVLGLGGDDRLSSAAGSVSGGDGNDVVIVYGPVRIDGGFGNDRLFGHSEGRSEVHGGPGDDTLDVVDEACEGTECSISPDADPFDCGPGTDVVYVDPGDVAPPDCEIVGRVTDDRPVTLRATDGPDRITGSTRDERIEGLGGDDFLGGRGGRDHLLGGDGDDILDGDRRAGFDDKGYKDRLSGGDGDDTIRARDDARDSIRCGAGDDTVTADRDDRVADDCETVSRR